MDRDFDQKLTFAEFMGEESHIEKLFKSMDKNNDGFVTKKVKLRHIVLNYQIYSSNWNLLFNTYLTFNLLSSFSKQDQRQHDFKIKDTKIQEICNLQIKPSITFWTSVNLQEFNDVCQNLSEEQVTSLLLEILLKPSKISYSFGTLLFYSMEFET